MNCEPTEGRSAVCLFGGMSKEGIIAKWGGSGAIKAGLHLVGFSSASHPTPTTMSAPSIKSKDVYEEALPTDSDELELVKFHCP